MAYFTSRLLRGVTNVEGSQPTLSERQPRITPSHVDIHSLTDNIGAKEARLHQQRSEITSLKSKVLKDLRVYNDLQNSGVRNNGDSRAKELQEKYESIRQQLEISEKETQELASQLQNLHERLHKTEEARQREEVKAATSEVRCEMLLRENSIERKLFDEKLTIMDQQLTRSDDKIWMLCDALKVAITATRPPAGHQVRLRPMPNTLGTNNTASASASQTDQLNCRLVSVIFRPEGSERTFTQKFSMPLDEPDWTRRMHAMLSAHDVLRSHVPTEPLETIFQALKRNMYCINLTARDKHFRFVGSCVESATDVETFLRDIPQHKYLHLSIMHASGF